ncbi:MAG: MBL fold metallo-hydrolase [Stenotrophobium sp.]
MRIKILGCSGGVGPGLRTTSILVDDEILIDAGTGVGDLSLGQQRQIAHVFLTHSHLDHVCGLAFMADNLFDLIDRPIEVRATAETLGAIRAHIFNWKIWPDFSQLPDENHPLIRFTEIQQGVSTLVGAHQLTAFRVLHTVPAVGYVVHCGAGVFAFSGDTYATDDLWNFLNGLQRLDTLMIEIAFPDEQQDLGRASKHFTPALLGRELKKLKHQPELLLTHHKPGCEQIIERQCRQALKGWDYRHLQRGYTIQL